MKVSNNDNRTYHQLTLDNGLKALLVSDYSSDKSAAALTVNAGHFDDPIDRQGMAHFLEHMLFLGTKQHPQPGQFSQFISQAGGQSNAWTGTEHSCYFFDCAQQQFFDALALFAEFFVEPLLDASQTQNERNAIDAEFKMKIKDDGRRIYQVHKETVNPLHPFAKFSVGNSETLSNRDACIADEVREFFQQHYQAQWMTLVVAGPHSLVELEAQIRQQFNPIKGTSQQKCKINTPLYRKQDQRLLLHIAPRKHMQKLIVSFAMGGIDDLYKHKSVSFLAHLLGYEGEGSLYSILKQQGWINALSAGGGVSGSNFKDFNISFALTDEGIDYYEDIIEMVFEYIALIKIKTSSLPLLYKDKKTLLDIAFNNQEPSRLLEWVSNISVNMHHYEPDDYLYGDYIMQGFNEQLHTRICNFLIPDNMRVVLIHPDVSAQLKARWYHTPYQVEQLSTEWLSALANIDTPLPEMQLPKVNPYLQVENELYDVTQKSHTPTLLKDKPGFAFWFKQDATFRVTKGHFYIEIDSLLGIKNTKHMALTRLFADLLMDSMAEQYYPAELAGLNYHINSHQGGLTLHTAGLSGNQITLALQLLEHMLHAVISAPRFAEYKKQLIRHWKNHNHNKPVSELFSVLGAKLMPWNPEPLALAKALKNISFNEFCQFRNQFFDSVYIKAFLHGNWQQQHALDMQKQLRALFSKSEILEDLKRPLIVLDSYQHQHIEKPGCEYALVYYIQAQTDKVFEKVALMMLNQLISQQYFESLRTQQQLGYLVGAGYAPFNTRAGIAFYIQSPNINAQQLLTKHDQFVSQFIEQLDLFDDAIWQDASQALRLQVAEKDKNLRLRAQRFWIAITNDDHQFNMQKRLVKQIDTLDKEQLISFIKMVFSSSHPKIALRCN
ncbi:Protease 3 [Pseudoalteromonas holothuriae]|uniref:Protease 3 n=1 Tax=Pseudoalteromonas holothuriae TaxID=2963714 RepID=A0A9W4QZ24_9GAMM|nr:MULTISPECIES: insulinase family protein [unclassified Pseudoalteromonas]CAH9059557.1 Protease 3 [Pseudoalteromonas sp. CIP111854]CAH9064264.1 Protease 3 [Pseudoalteromonas sp. CIP111951]